MNKLLEHHNFIRSTDRKSVCTQIKKILEDTKKDIREQLKRRRGKLKILLEFEDKIFEDEFANQVKNRVTEAIHSRREVLLKIKEESTVQSKEFLEKKRIQQHLESCYEIRQALRIREMYNVKECQLEQMLEKERSLKQERDSDKYWADVHNKSWEKYDKSQRHEDCLKQKMKKDLKETLDWQMKLQDGWREEERQIRAAEAKKIDDHLKEMQLAALNKITPEKVMKQAEYRQDLLDLIAEKEQRKKTEDCEAAKEHQKMCEDLQRLEEEEKVAFLARKRALNEATRDYIAYVKRVNQWEADAQKVRDDRIDELDRVYKCTKGNIHLVKMRKAEEAARCFAELKKQVCEQYERNLREYAERKECKILENRFVHPEKSRAEILEQRRKNREGLDKQIELLKRIRAEEEEIYKKDLMQASNDPERCKELCAKYISERIDYLEPHPNWFSLQCPNKIYLGKTANHVSLSAGQVKTAANSSFCPCEPKNLKI